MNILYLAHACVIVFTLAGFPLVCMLLLLDAMYELLYRGSAVVFSRAWSSHDTIALLPRICLGMQEESVLLWSQFWLGGPPLLLPSLPQLATGNCQCYPAQCLASGRIFQHAQQLVLGVWVFRHNFQNSSTHGDHTICKCAVTGTIKWVWSLAVIYTSMCGPWPSGRTHTLHRRWEQLQQPHCWGKDRFSFRYVTSLSPDTIQISTGAICNVLVH